MKTIFKKCINSKLGIAVLTGLLNFIGTLINDWLREKPILTTFISIINFITCQISKFFSLEIKLYWFFVIFIFIFLVYKLILFFKQKNGKPYFYNYNEGILKKWRWTWEWQWDNKSKSWKIQKLKAYCPKCNSQLLIQANFLRGTSAECPRCNFLAIGEECEIPFKIESIIHDNIDRMEDINNK